MLSIKRQVKTASSLFHKDCVAKREGNTDSQFLNVRGPGRRVFRAVLAANAMSCELRSERRRTSDDMTGTGPHLKLLKSVLRAMLGLDGCDTTLLAPPPPSSPLAGGSVAVAAAAAALTAASRRGFSSAAEFMICRNSSGNAGPIAFSRSSAHACTSGEPPAQPGVLCSLL